MLLLGGYSGWVMEEAPRTPYIRQTSAQGGAPPPSPAQAYISRTYLRPVQGKASS